MNEQRSSSSVLNFTGTKPRNRTLPPNLTRRAHRKSRNGCHRCKRRRIKCDETRPSCGHCAGRLIICTYPEPSAHSTELYQSQSQTQSSVSNAVEYPLHTIAKPFSWADVRALHHFLVFCPPSLPFGNRDVWISHVPQIAHEVPFLMQGILAFGASHLSRLTKSSDLERQALLHRCRAIAGIRKHVQHIGSWSILDIDAAIATSYVLAFQATHILDGMDDYLAFVSGCGSLTQHVRSHGLSSGFKLSNGRATTRYGADIALLLAGEIDLGLVEEACEMFDVLEVTITDKADVEFFTAVRTILRSFEDGACAGVLAAMNMFSVWHHFAGVYLRTFLKDDSTMSQLLLLYFLTVQTVLWALLPHHWWSMSLRQLPPGQPFVELFQWITVLIGTVSSEYEAELIWPKQIMSQLKDVLHGVTVVPGIALDQYTKDSCVRNIQRNAHIVLGDILRVCADINTWFEALLKIIIENAASETHFVNSSDRSFEQKATRRCHTNTDADGDDLIRRSDCQNHQLFSKHKEQRSTAPDFSWDTSAAYLLDLMPDVPG